MTRTNIAWISAVLILSGALALAASLPANPQSPVPLRPVVRPIEMPPNGRYQIVNGTPELAHNIMLLDALTGKTWEVCKIDKEDAWCGMHQYQDGEFGPVEDQKPSTKTAPANPCLLVGDPNCSAR